MDWKTTAIILAAAIVIIAVFMEAYKKFIRKDRAGRKEIMCVAIALSMLVTTFSFYGFDLPGHDLAIGLYFLGIYSAQFFVDMKLIKALIRLYAKKKGVTLDGFGFNE